MSGKLWLAGGFAAGYVLGTRAGRERYEQLAAAVRKVKDDPAVQNALEIVQNQAERAYATGRAAVQDKLVTSRAEKRDAERDADLVSVGSAGIPEIP